MTLSEQLDAGFTDVLTETHTEVGQTVAPLVDVDQRVVTHTHTVGQVQFLQLTGTRTLYDVTHACVCYSGKENTTSISLPVFTYNSLDV